MTNCFRSAVLAEIEGAIYFRSGVSERYPDDRRNIQCVESLWRLKENLDQVPEDDPRMVRCSETYRDKHLAAGNGDCSWTLRLCEGRPGDTATQRQYAPGNQTSF